MKSVKILNEEIDGLRYEAKGIFEAAKRQDRELNEDEAKRFDEITDKKSGLIAQLKNQLAEAEERERAILEMSVREERQRSLEAIDGEMTAQQPRLNRVLPTDGVLPGEDRREPARIYHRMAKLRAFKNERDAYNCGMWLRAAVAREYSRRDDDAEMFCQRNGMQLSAANSGGSGAAGGYIVPAPLSQTLIDVRESVGVARQVMNVQPMTADTLTIPEAIGGLVVYYPEETQALTESQVAFKQVGLVVKKRAVLSFISQELQDDALVSITDHVVSQMGHALAKKEDADFILGDGSSSYGKVQGLINSIGSAGVATAATGHDTWAELDVADFTACMGKLPDKYSDDPAWICSANFYWTVMARILLQGGGNTVADLQAGPRSAQFFGRTVYFTDHMPKTTAVDTIAALFGTFRMGAILGDRNDIRISRSDDVRFTSDQTAIKATSRIDMNIHAPGDGTNAGAYVALKTAS